VNGETLKDVLSRKKLADIEIENYLEQMVAALEYVHSQGLVHRDVKPSNFIFNEKGVLKLTDFGISKSIEGDLDGHTQTSTSMSMGTPMYMSPEQVRSTKDVTYLSDIYSLGVILWEMAAGKKPYDLSNLSAFDLQLKIVQEDLPLTETKWDDIIKKATKKEENERFLNDKDLLDFHFEKSVVNDLEKTVINENREVFKKSKKNVIQTKEDKGKKKKRILFFVTFAILFLGLIISIKLINSNKKVEDSDFKGITKYDSISIKQDGNIENTVIPLNENSKSKTDPNNVEFENESSVKKLKTINSNISSFGKAEVLSVERTTKYTIIKIKQILFKKGASVWIEPNAYIIDLQNNEKLYIKNAYNLPFPPNKKYANYDNEVFEFELYFPSVKLNCNTIDFIESASSPWKFYNLKIEKNNSITNSQIEFKIQKSKIENEKIKNGEQINISNKSESNLRKTIKFHNNSQYNTISVAICFWDGENWINKGWYNVKSGQTFNFDLPKNYKHSSVYYYAKASGVHWEGKGIELCINESNAFEYKYDAFEFLQTPGHKCSDPVWYTEEKVNQQMTDVKFGK
jgi:serine/threonine protein kinase